MTDVTTLIVEDHTQLRDVFEKMRTGSPSQRELLLPLTASLLIARSRAVPRDVENASCEQPTAAATQPRAAAWDQRWASTPSCSFCTSSAPGGSWPVPSGPSIEA